jgi:hypothetical protein
MTWLVLACLFVAVVAYPIYDGIMVRRHLRRVGLAYCEQHGVTFVGIAHAKSHLSVMYKDGDSGKRHYAKCILHTSFGRFRRVEWLA